VCTKPLCSGVLMSPLLIPDPFSFACHYCHFIFFKYGRQIWHPTPTPTPTPTPPLPWLLQADSNSRMDNNMYFRTSFKYFPIPDFTDFRVFRGFGLCNHLFSVVSSLWEVRLGGAECGFAKTRFQKLRSYEFSSKNTFLGENRRSVAA